MLAIPDKKRLRRICKACKRRRFLWYRTSGLIWTNTTSKLWRATGVVQPQFYPRPRGWVRLDGVIGTKDITGKYPTEEDFLRSVLPRVGA